MDPDLDLYEYNYTYDLGNDTDNYDLGNDTDNYDNCELPPHYYTTIWAHQVHIYATYVIVALGSLSNVIAFAVLVGSKRMRTSPCGLFLITLAVADTCVLLGELLSILASETTSIILFRSLSDTECGILWYFKYFSKAVSTFVIVCISANRCLAIANPIKSRNLVSAKLILSQIISVCVIVALLFLYVPFFMGNDGCGCDVNIKYHLAYFVATVVVQLVICDIITSFVILILSLGTISIIISSRKTMRRRMSHMSDRKRKAEQYQLTGLLLAVSLTFFFLRLPYIITWIINYVTGAFSRSATLINVHYICYCVALLNYAINLYLYSICSASFRSEFRRLCCLWKHKQNYDTQRKSRFPSASRSSISVRKSSFSTLQTGNTLV